MNEYEKLIADNLWNYLKSKLNGKIFCGIRDNTLKVSVKCDEIYFEQFVEDIAEKVVLGQFITPVYGSEFLRNYKEFVKEQTNKRFYRE